MDYTFLLGSLENILGKSYKKAKTNYAFVCPFCNHHKPKLEINLETTEQGENPWQCWVCQTKGKTIRSLLTQLHISSTDAKEVLKYVRKGEEKVEIVSTVVALPKEFKPLSEASSTSVIANGIKNYLYERHITDLDIIKYNIGYCRSGEYSGRVIVPSYNSSNVLNYFVSRVYSEARRKYKNPEASRDIIFFENLINWKKPVILCEGVFDAMAIKRNAIPLLGKGITKSLMKKLISSPVQDIYIALDNDALREALKHSETFLSMGKRVFLIDLDKKDPSKMGFEAFTKKIQIAKELDFVTLMQYKLNV